MGNFYSDVIVNDSRFHSTQPVSDINLLEPITRQKVLAIIADAKAQGMDLMVYETYRSQERQQILFNQGVTKLRIVGVHHFGLACDLVKNVNGEPSWKGDFSLLGVLAHAHALVWGGDWGNPSIPHSFIDVVHVQRCSLAKQSSLFSLQWYPDDNYNPYS
jgi:hypothetical protein